MKQVKICLGRFQPFTLGHLKMVTYKDLKGPDKEQQDKLREQPNLKEIAKQKTIILAISTPNEKVDTRHPFNDQLMKDEFDLIKKNYKDEIENIFYVKSADICAWGELLKQNGYQASVWLTGSDEFKMYKYMAIKVPEYEEHNRDNRDCKDAYTKSFYVENIERTDDGDFVSSISGTKVRQALIDNDKELFTKMMPKGTDKYFDKFKEAIENAPEPVKKTTKKKIKEGMISLKDYINEALNSKILEGYFTTNKNEVKKQLDKFLYDITWHESVAFESIEECNFIIDNLQSEYNFKLTKSYDNHRKTSTIILKGQTRKEHINVTLEFYPNGDEYNDESWCDLRDNK